MPLSAHQSLQLSAGGPTWPTIATCDLISAYETTPAPGGLKNVYLGANWGIQLNSKYRLLSGVHLTLSPIVDERNGVRLSSALSYHF